MEQCLVERAFHYTQTLPDCIARGKTRAALFLYRQGARCENCLAIAARENRLELVEFFITRGYDKHTALRWASQRGHMRIIDYLWRAGANIHVNNDLPLRVAARGGFLPAVQFLVSKGANIHAEQDMALRWAASFGHLSVVEYLYGLDHPRQVGAALQLAAANGHLEVVMFLHQIGGADIDADNSAALRLACRGNYIRVIKYLYKNPLLSSL